MIRKVEFYELAKITGAGANSATENVGHQKNSGKGNNGGGGVSSGGDQSCPPYMNPDFKNCLNGILGGMVAG